MTRPTLVLRPEARADLIAIGDYIARDDRRRAVTFVAEVEAAIAAIADRPGSFPARDDLYRGLRAARYGRYLIFFLSGDAQIDVVRVLHGARDLKREFST